MSKVFDLSGKPSGQQPQMTEEEMYYQEMIRQAKLWQEADDVVCKACGSNIFAQAYILKRVNKVHLGSTKDKIMNAPIFICASCGEVVEDYLNMLKKPEEDKNS